MICIPGGCSWELPSKISSCKIACTSEYEMEGVVLTFLNDTLVKETHNSHRSEYPKHPFKQNGTGRCFCYLRLSNHSTQGVGKPVEPKQQVLEKPFFHRMLEHTCEDIHPSRSEYMHMKCQKIKTEKNSNTKVSSQAHNNIHSVSSYLFCFNIARCNAMNAAVLPLMLCTPAKRQNVSILIMHDT